MPGPLRYDHAIGHHDAERFVTIPARGLAIAQREVIPERLGHRHRGRPPFKTILRFAGLHRYGPPAGRARLPQLQRHRRRIAPQRSQSHLSKLRAERFDFLPDCGQIHITTRLGTVGLRAFSDEDAGVETAAPVIHSQVRIRPGVGSPDVAVDNELVLVCSILQAQVGDIRIVVAKCQRRGGRTPAIERSRQRDGADFDPVFQNQILVRPVSKLAVVVLRAVQRTGAFVVLNTPEAGTEDDVCDGVLRVVIAGEREHVIRRLQHKLEATERDATERVVTELITRLGLQRDYLRRAGNAVVDSAGELVRSFARQNHRRLGIVRPAVQHISRELVGTYFVVGSRNAFRCVEHDRHVDFDDSLNVHDGVRRGQGNLLKLPSVIAQREPKPIRAMFRNDEIDIGARLHQATAHAPAQTFFPAAVDGEF